MTTTMMLNTIRERRKDTVREKHPRYNNLSIENKIKILIVDDHNLFRECLMALLGHYPDCEIVGEAADGRAAVILCGHYQPDVVLMDISMPNMDGIAATALIRAQHPAIQVIALTSFNEAVPVQNMLKAGAISYLVKNASIDELVRAIRDAHAGIPTLSTDATQALISATRQLPKVGYDLTDRERQIVGLMTGGLNNRTIAAQLVISQSTVKNHVSNIFSKLGSSSRTKAVALAVEHKLWLRA